jgi:hypothetical protein
MRYCRFQQSATIESTAFDVRAKTLAISFKQTGRYIYYDVPADLFDAFCKAPSAGSFFNTHIREHFRFRRDPARKRFGPNA